MTRPGRREMNTIEKVVEALTKNGWEVARTGGESTPQGDTYYLAIWRKKIGQEETMNGGNR